MGNLTDDLTRLRRHIDDSRESRLAQQNARVSTVSAQIAEFASFRISNGLRDAQARAGFVSDNANDVKRLINNFRHTREVTGQQDRLSRAAFVNDTSKKTSDLLVGFNTDRKNQAAQSAKDRADFITSLTNSVAAFINEAANDRATAHAVFFGGVAPKKKTIYPA